MRFAPEPHHGGSTQKRARSLPDSILGFLASIPARGPRLKNRGQPAGSTGRVQNGRDARHPVLRAVNREADARLDDTAGNQQLIGFQRQRLRGDPAVRRDLPEVGPGRRGTAESGNNIDICCPHPGYRTSATNTRLRA